MNTSHSNGRPRRDSGDAGASRNACVDVADGSGDDLEAGDSMAIGRMVARCPARVQQNPSPPLRPPASGRRSPRLSRAISLVVPIGSDCLERRRATMGRRPYLCDALAVH